MGSKGGFSKNSVFCTQEEIAFITGLGTHCVSNAPRAALLEKYIRAGERREEWGAVDKEAALSFARVELEKTRTPA